MVEAIDQALGHQPVGGTTDGTLAQGIIVNRMAFDPQPRSQLGPWAQQHGIDRPLGLEAAWRDDDRLGQLLEGRVAPQVTICSDGGCTRPWPVGWEGRVAPQVTIWAAVLSQAVQPYQIELDWLREDTPRISFEGAYADDGQSKGPQPKGPKGGEAPRIPQVVRGYDKGGKPKQAQEGPAGLEPAHRRGQWAPAAVVPPLEQHSDR